MIGRPTWRVESDGMPQRTVIYDGQGNQVPLDGVVSLRWEIDATHHGTLTLVVDAELDASGDLVERLAAQQGPSVAADQPPVPDPTHCETGP